MQPIQIPSKVGEDGVLDLRVPLGAAEANAEVLVTIEPTGNGNGVSRTDWHEFVRRTYGSCAGLGLDEPADMPLQQRLK
jgi:hypothetical protein